MKLEILKSALQQYVLSADCPVEDRQQAFDALSECNQLAERYDDRELWKDTVYLIAAGSMSDLLNIATYDTYGKLAKIHSGDVPFSYYAHDVRKLGGCGLTDLTNDALMLGYEVIADLWRDNEADGSHKPDGTFEHTVIPNQTALDYIQKSRSYLRQAVAVVKDYQLVNSDVLEQAENDRLLKLIDDIHNLIG